jgi:putative DNA primase/helicase
MTAPILGDIPIEYKARNQWTLWKTITRAGKLTKVPFRITGDEGDSSDPSAWSSYAEAVEAFNKGGYDGIGFTFDVLDPYAGVDLDHCINEDGTIKPKAKAILDKLNTYCEISPSGTGIKIFLKAKNPVSIRKKDGKYQQG